MSDLRTLLTEVYRANARLTPPDVVNTARDPLHPLHHRLEWDDSKGGEKYRLVQAAELIRSVKITYAETSKGGPKHVRAFHSVIRVDGPSYLPIEDIAVDPFTRELVLRQAEREWRELRRKYGHLEEFMTAIRADLAS